MMLNKPFITAVLLLILSGGLTGFAASRPVPVVIATNLERLPLDIDGYKGTEDSFPEAVYKELNADKHVYRHYRAPDGSVIDLYIGYYGTAKGGRTAHNPYACLPSSGASIVDTGQVALQQSVGSHVVPVNYILSKKEGSSTVMLHWYQTAGNTVVSTGLGQNIERFMGRVLRNRNDGAFVRLTQTTADSRLLESRKKIEGFATSLLNLLPDYWPVEK